jgi:hypothetical protein
MREIVHLLQIIAYAYVGLSALAIGLVTGGITHALRSLTGAATGRSKPQRVGG